MDKVGPSLGLARLRSWMARRRISQVTLAGQLGISTTRCSFIVNGKSRPDLDTANKLQRIAGVMTTDWSTPARGPLPVLPEQRGRRRKAA